MGLQQPGSTTSSGAIRDAVVDEAGTAGQHTRAESTVEYRSRPTLQRSDAARLVTMPARRESLARPSAALALG